MVIKKVAGGMGNMFDNAGGVSKGLAKVACWLGIIGSVISGIYMMVLSGQMYRGGET